ncbi:hypothetical protein L484_025324 [Morus notabilis]|uniref:Subtilisin-like protease n=1 Tax=Morus notabilis TaxID=981085 RepID=W9RUL9_9ROSA|nr:hypothetical protein L484_025324 [Morus notabilis]
MGKFEALLFHFFFTIFILVACFWCKSLDEDRKAMGLFRLTEDFLMTQAYIVYMGALPDGVSSTSTHHFSILHRIVQGRICNLGYLDRRLVKGKMMLCDRVAGINAAYRAGALGPYDQLQQQVETLTTTVERMAAIMTRREERPDYMPSLEDALVNPTDDAAGNQKKGDQRSDAEGTGRWEADSARPEEEPKRRLRLQEPTTGKAPTTAGMEPNRDDVGHGTHTASTAVGNHVKDASFYGLAKGTARGGVPSARIAAYKVCDVAGCNSDAPLAAFDDAIDDGVDIITISIGSSEAKDSVKYPIAIGAFHAMVKGILTLNSAGNNEPSFLSVSSVAPWMMSVAASSTDRRTIDNVVLADGKTIIGNSVNSFELNGTLFPLVDGKSASTKCSEFLASSCDVGCLDKDLVKGKIALCDSREGINEAYASGADYKTTAMMLSRPTLNPQDNEPRGTILKSEAEKDDFAPKVVSFSSRGPNLISSDIRKPDITGPGVDILASYSPIVPPSSSPEDKRRVKFNIESGTSMSCPHVAGAAAYVKTFHPDWSPSAIKSSLMTTAWVMNKTEGGEFEYGSGHVNPVQAISPGLVYDAFEADYINFLCSSGWDDNTVSLISGHKSNCPKDSRLGSPRDLNCPSMAAQVSTRSFSIKIHRRVKNVGHPNSTYKATIFPRTKKLYIKVEPSILSFKSLDEEKSFDVIVQGSDGINSVRSPIILYDDMSR